MYFIIMMLLLSCCLIMFACFADRANRQTSVSLGVGTRANRQSSVSPVVSLTCLCWFALDMFYNLLCACVCVFVYADVLVLATICLPNDRSSYRRTHKTSAHDLRPNHSIRFDMDLVHGKIWTWYFDMDLVFDKIRYGPGISFGKIRYGPGI